MKWLRARVTLCAAAAAALYGCGVTVDGDANEADGSQIANALRAHIVAVRDGNFDVLPLPDGTTLVSNPIQTLRLDGNNQPIAAVPTGGEVASDGTRNVYVATIAGGVLRVSALTPAFALRFTVEYVIAKNSRVLDAIWTFRDTLALAIGGDRIDEPLPRFVLQLAGDGSVLRSDAVPADSTAIRLAQTQYAIARQTASGVVFETRSYMTASLIRAAELEGPSSIDRLLLAPDGSLVAGGHLHGTVTFGDGNLAPFTAAAAESFDAFIVALSPGLTFRFARELTTQVEDIATNGREIAVSLLTETPLAHGDFVVFNAAGTVVERSTGSLAELSAGASFVDSFRAPGEIAIAKSGRVYFNVDASRADTLANRVPLLVTIDPAVPRRDDD